MKNILLVTIQDYKNIGNRLQNYALQMVLEGMNVQVSNLTVVPVAISRRSLLKSKVKHVLGLFGIEKYYHSYSQFMRIQKCVEFTQNRISDIKYIDRDRINRYALDNYSAAISGSDQIWHNWGRIKKELQYFYLDFIEPGKRIAYAPSFGFTEFPKEDIEEHRKGLMGMKALSCREQEGCRLIKELTGRDAQKVLDPTLLLTREEWEEIEKKPEFRVPENYLLMFFLGNIPVEYQREVDRIKDIYGLEIININDLNDPQHYAISPDEFIWLIHHAGAVCTDSFHASVFSIIFSRNLRVFERMGKYEKMFGRLHDLLKPLGLLELAYGYGDGSKLSTVLEPDAGRQFHEEKENSLRYLRESLGINEN